MIKHINKFAKIILCWYLRKIHKNQTYHHTIKNKMKYQIKRLDGESDDITTQSFENYDDAYDLLALIYADICCSDADYDDRPYYEIIEIKNVDN